MPMRKSGSFGRSNSKPAETSSNKKSLSFSQDLCQIQLVECLANDDQTNNNTLWYDGRELAQGRKQEIKKAKHAQLIAGAGNSIETDDITWRGFEDIQGHWCRVEKSACYTTAVVRHYHTQVARGNNGHFDADELKKLAKNLSKEERTRARNMALKDMQEVGIPRTSRNSTGTSRRLRKSSSGAGLDGNKRPSSGSLRKTISGAGLASLRKSGSASMLKLSQSIGNGMSKMTGGKSSSKSNNFEWLRKSTGTNASKPNRMAVMSA